MKNKLAKLIEVMDNASTQLIEMEGLEEKPLPFGLIGMEGLEEKLLPFGLSCKK